MAWTPIKLRKGGDVTFVGEAEGAGGGSQPGALRVLGPFPFTFETPDLDSGVEFYTPTENEILYDAWISVAVGVPFLRPAVEDPVYGDIGTFAGSGYGLFRAGIAPIDLRVQDSPLYDPTLICGGESYDGVTAANLSLVQNGVYAPPLVQRIAPLRFNGVTPLKVCVSPDGSVNSGPSGALSGEAAVYLVVATPSLV